MRGSMASLGRAAREQLQLSRARPGNDPGDTRRQSIANDDGRRRSGIPMAIAIDRLDFSEFAIDRESRRMLL